MTPQQIEALILFHGPKYAGLYKVDLIPLYAGDINLDIPHGDPRELEIRGVHVMDCVREDPALKRQLETDFAGLPIRIEYLSSVVLDPDRDLSYSTNTDDPKMSIGHRLDELRRRSLHTPDEAALLRALEERMRALDSS